MCTSMMRIVLDIINLKSRMGLEETDATFRKQVSWYYYALTHDLVETEYEGSNLIGFVEWVRLNYVPKSLEDVHEEVGYQDFTKGPVAFVCNAISTHKSIYKFRKRFLDKIKDAELICFNRKKRGKIVCFINIRRGYALSN